LELLEKELAGIGHLDTADGISNLAVGAHAFIADETALVADPNHELIR
jgi:hypothetical protein